MKREEIKIGNVYGVLVNRRIQPVKIIHEKGYVSRPTYKQGDYQNKTRQQHAGWTGINQNTGREINVRSATRCRFECELVDGKWKRKPTRVEVPVIAGTPGSAC